MYLLPKSQLSDANYPKHNFNIRLRLKYLMSYVQATSVFYIKVIKMASVPPMPGR